MNQVNIQLPGDSLEYEILHRAAVKGLEDTESGMTCEIGLRSGGGSRWMMQAIAETKTNRTHVAIDPYGNIDYPDRDGVVMRYDYNNHMRDMCIPNISYYAAYLKVNTLFFCLEDTEFFQRFRDGVPVYNEGGKTLETEYAVVHFDGPHQTMLIKDEIDWFAWRTPVGGTYVFDDLDNYDHDEVERYLLEDVLPATTKWETLERSYRKASYQRIE